MIRLMLIFVALISAPQLLYAQIGVEEYCADVLAYSHTLRDERLATEGAYSEATARRKDYLPFFDLVRQMNLDFRSPEVGRRWSWLTRLDVSQPIFLGGKVRARAKQAQLAYDASVESGRAAEIFVRYTAEVAYWSLSRAESNYNAMNDYHTIVSSLRDIVAERYAEGYISKSDLLQVESRLSDAEYKLSSAAQQRDVALHNFNSLRGVEPATRVSLAESILTNAAMPRREEVADIVLRHPDYAASRLDSERAFWGIREVRAAYLPQIDLALYGLWQPNMPHSKGGGTRLDGGVLLSFSTPIFHFGQRKHAVAAARSDYLRSENLSSEVVDDIKRDESDGWTNLLSTHDRVEATQRNLSIARENLDISTYSYHEGVASILDVLQAQLSWLQIYQNAIAAQYDYAVAVAAYRYIAVVE